MTIVYCFGVYQSIMYRAFLGHPCPVEANCLVSVVGRAGRSDDRCIPSTKDLFYRLPDEATDDRCQIL